MSLEHQSSCNPSKNDVCDDKGGKTISSIFSISDKAFALLVVFYNKSHQWKADAKKMRKKRIFGEIENKTGTQGDKSKQNKKRNKESPTKERKQLTNACSGKKGVWYKQIFL